MRNKSWLLLLPSLGILLAGIGVLLLKTYPKADYAFAPWLGAVMAAAFN